MTPKLLFFDIDGTLLDYTGKMPASAKEALRQARLAGHRLVICSGRSGHQLSDWMFTDFDGIINCTGAGVKIGNVFGSRFEKKAQIAGGCILILLGVKILLEHLGVLM